MKDTLKKSKKNGGKEVTWIEIYFYADYESHDNMQLYHPRVLFYSSLSSMLIHTLTYFSFSLAWQGECHVLLAVEPPNNQDTRWKRNLLDSLAI